MQTSSFIFQGMNSCRVHLRLLLQKLPTLQNWASDTPKLNMWFSLVPLHQEAFFLLYGEEQDCTLSWRNCGQMFIFCVIFFFFFFLMPILKCVGSHFLEC